MLTRLVRLGQIDILADHADRDFVLRMLELFDEVRPHRQIGRLRRELEFFADDRVEPLVVQHLRNLVDAVRVPHGNHRVFGHVREHRDLRAFVVRNAAVGAAQQHVRRDADFTQLLHAVLRGLGFQFAGGGDPGHQREVHEARAVAAHAQAHLTRGLEERQRFDVAHGAAHFDDRDVRLTARRGSRAAFDERLDFIRDVRDDLHRLAEIIAAAFLADHRFVDLARGEVVGLAHLRADEALIVAEVEVGLRSVFRHEHFAVLKRAHRAGVDIDVGIELEEGDFKTARFEDRGEGSGGNTLAEGRYYAAGDENIFGHRWMLAGKTDYTVKQGLNPSKIRATSGGRHAMAAAIAAW